MAILTQVRLNSKSTSCGATLRRSSSAMPAGHGDVACDGLW
jgi:hypothetical protein